MAQAIACGIVSTVVPFQWRHLWPAKWQHSVGIQIGLPCASSFVRGGQRGRSSFLKAVRLVFDSGIREQLRQRAFDDFRAGHWAVSLDVLVDFL